MFEFDVEMIFEDKEMNSNSRNKGEQEVLKKDRLQNGQIVHFFLLRLNLLMLRNDLMVLLPLPDHPEYSMSFKFISRRLLLLDLLHLSYKRNGIRSNKLMKLGEQLPVN